MKKTKTRRKWPGEGMRETRLVQALDRMSAFRDEIDDILDDDDLWNGDKMAEFSAAHALESAAWMVGRAMFRDGSEVTTKGIRENLERMIRGWYRARKRKPAEHWEMAEWHVFTAQQTAETYLSRLHEAEPSKAQIVSFMLRAVGLALVCCSDIVHAVDNGRWTKEPS